MASADDPAMPSRRPINQSPLAIQHGLPANFLDLPNATPDLVGEISVDLDKMHGMMKGPVEFTSDRKVRFLMFLARFGLQYKAAMYAGVSYQCAKNHKKSDEPFGEAWEQALEIFRESLESEALRRAIDGWDEPVYQKGELVGTIHRHSERMMELLLKAHIPAKFRENVKLDLSVGTTTGVLIVEKQLGVDEWEQKYGAAAIEGTITDALIVPHETHDT